jgi:colanic acid/amylovoran biosynthesis glycosyltransferase
VNVLYLVKQFPSLSQTFVLSEVAELTRRGCRVFVRAALDPADGVVAVPPEIAARTSYLSYDYCYAYARAGGRGDDAVRDEVEPARTTPDALVSLEERRRLWDVALGAEPEEGRARRGFLEALALLRLARQEDVRHVHCDFAEDNVRLAWLVQQAAGLPFTFKMRAYDIFAEPAADLPRWAAAAERVLTISDYNRDHICRTFGLPPDKVAVVRDGIALERIPPVERYAHRPLRIVTAGRLVEKKGTAVLVEACASLRRRGVDFRCDIYGEGPLRDALRGQVEALGLRGLVRLEGARPHDELLRLLETASVFVLPCVVAAGGDRDGTPNVLMEAMARALPVVSTRVSGIPEVVDHGSDGLLVPPGDAESLAAAIARIDADPALADGLRLRARSKAERAFRIERNADEFLALVAPLAPAASS